MSASVQMQAEEGTVKMEQDQQEMSQQPQHTSEWTLLRQRVEDNPNDEAAWNAYVDKAEESGDNEKIKEAYEALLEKYPNTSSAQISYLNHFLSNQSLFPFAESLFARFLRASPSVDLWKFYLVYVRRVNTGPQTRDIVRKAYEFALNHVGQDKDSADIWAEYIQFVKSGETSTTWEEQQKMDALRKIYQRAVQIPLDNVEILWKDYEAFENGLNRITAKKFMQDLTPAFVTARSKLRDLRKHLATLLPSPPSGSGRPSFNLPRKPTFSPEDRALVGAWKQYLKWEESNPLEIEDKTVLITRLQGVYRKAVIRMRFFSEIWFMAYTWTMNVGRQDEAIALLKAGIEANPTNFVLNFALAENYELAKNYGEVRSLFDRLLQGIQKELEGMEAKITAASQQSFSSDNGVVNPEGTGDDSMQVDHSASNGTTGLMKEASFVTQRTSSSSSSNTTSEERELHDRKQEYGLVWIMYIRFTLRSEGVDASRKVFSAARKDKWSPWEVFEAAAMMEYHVAGQLPVANKILALAHTKFPDEIDLVIRYLNFLLSVNDENNARALFERAVGTFPAEKARLLWERWARYEYQYGSLEAALKLEKRMAEVFPNDPPIKRFAQRHSFLNIDGIANRDLGFALSRHTIGLSRTDTIPTINIGAPGPSSAGVVSAASQAATATASPARRAQQSPERPPGRHNYGQGPHKRQRDLTPPVREREREWERDRDRRGGPSRDRRFASPAYDNRDRERSPPRRAPQAPEREEHPRVTVPQVLSTFVGSLPPPNTFDGPVFRTDDLMQLLRNAVIPGSTSRVRSPPPPPRQTRPPPDYGPYRGPNYRGRY